MINASYLKRQSVNGRCGLRELFCLPYIKNKQSLKLKEKSAIYNLFEDYNPCDPRFLRHHIQVA